MSRNIKTYKCLQKHLGKTVHIINEDGIEFDAQVGYVGEGCLILHTEDKKADAATGWWEDKGGWSHYCREDRPYQITTELKSIALVKEKKPVKTKKKPGRKKVTYKTLEDLKANVGHYCTMYDGSIGFICELTCKEHEGNVRVLMNTKEGWTYDKDSKERDNAPKFVQDQYERAFNIWDNTDAEYVKVKKISSAAIKLEELDKKSFLNREQLLEHIGKRCKMSDRTEGLIVKASSGNPRILMKARANDHGWLYNESCEYDSGASVKVRGQYKYAWNICDDEDAEDISVVEILEDDDEKCAESSKTILDMTIREVLEKLDEIIKR